MEKVFDAIRQIQAEKVNQKSNFPEIELQFIVFRHNEHEIGKFRQLAKKLNVEKVSIKSAQIYNFAENSGNITTIEKFSRYRQKNGEWQLRKKMRNRCRRLWQGGVVLTDGRFVPCCFDKNGENSFGNVSNESVKTVWKNEKSLAFHRQILQNRSVIEICRNCSE